jgi:hypothetical protein
MELHLDTADHTAQLVEPDDFGAFAVVVKGGGPPDALAAFHQDIRSAGEAEVWVAAQSVVTWRGRAAADWEPRFRAMLAAVETHGWYDRDRDEIRAHVTSRQ